MYFGINLKKSLFFLERKRERELLLLFVDIVGKINNNNLVWFHKHECSQLKIILFFLLFVEYQNHKWERKVPAIIKLTNISKVQLFGVLLSLYKMKNKNPMCESMYIYRERILELLNRSLTILFLQLYSILVIVK